MLNLDSINAKVARAKDHRDLLDREIDAWFNSMPYTVVSEFDGDPKRRSKVVRLTRAPEFVRWSLILGDAMHCLRSALDHLTFAIAAHELPAAAVHEMRKTLAFSIYDTANDFNSKRHKIACLSLPVRDEIERAQSYNRHDAGVPPFLSILKEFDDTDKHRALTMALCKPFSFKIKDARNIPTTAKWWYTNESMEDGLRVVSLILPEPTTADVDFGFDLSMSVLVHHAHAVNGANSSEPRWLFDAIAAEVQIVIDQVVAAVADKTRLQIDGPRARCGENCRVVEATEDDRAGLLGFLRGLPTGRQKDRKFVRIQTHSGRVLAQQFGWEWEIDRVACREVLGEEL